MHNFKGFFDGISASSQNVEKKLHAWRLSAQETSGNRRITIFLASSVSPEDLCLNLAESLSAFLPHFRDRNIGWGCHADRCY
jgi:hypothetical protein